tara:strand:+ start:78 stop:455 length:378 start_codon:yes stop_codon:yes gene_type:complete
MKNKHQDDSNINRMSEGIDIIIDEAKTAAINAYKVSGAESMKDGIKGTLKTALSARANVVMVRVNKDSLHKIDELVDSGIVNSRSEAAAFLIKEGISSQSKLFNKISETTQIIRKAKEDLKDILN